MGVIVQRHGDIGVAHDILQSLGIHTGVGHPGTERVSEGVRGDVGQRWSGWLRSKKESERPLLLLPYYVSTQSHAGICEKLSHKANGGNA